MFTDRRDSGLQLAKKLNHYKANGQVLVLALARGGAVTGFEIAHSLGAPFDVFIVRKIGFPGQPEFAVGAISETGTIVFNPWVLSYRGVSKEYIDREVSRQKDEIARMVRHYRGVRHLEDLKGRTVILVDDGVATGATMKAAITAMKKAEVEKLIVAVPVAPPDTAVELASMVDEFVCLSTPADFRAVGQYYYDFTQVTDEEVADILKESQAISGTLTET
jgi:putative phosphoribosyl transferase